MRLVFVRKDVTKAQPDQEMKQVTWREGRGTRDEKNAESWSGVTGCADDFGQ